MVAITPAEIDNLTSQIENLQPVQGQDLAKLRDLVRVLAVSVRAQDEQIKYFENLVAVLKDGNAATAAAGAAALSALKTIAPPNATVDQQAATQAATKLRKDIQNSANISQTIASVANFAISVAGKFI